MKRIVTLLILSLTVGALAKFSAVENRWIHAVADSDDGGDGSDSGDQGDNGN